MTARREFLKLGVSLAVQPAPSLSAATRIPEQAAAGKGFPIEEATIIDLTERMTRSEITSVGLTRAYLGRIAGLDRGTMGLRNVIEVGGQ